MTVTDPNPCGGVGGPTHDYQPQGTTWRDLLAANENREDMIPDLLAYLQAQATHEATHETCARCGKTMRAD